LVNGLNANNDICSIEVVGGAAERGRKKSSMDVEKKTTQEAGSEDEDEAKIVWDNGDWGMDAEEDFFQVYKTRNARPV
jgi:hypothetical protein